MNVLATVGGQAKMREPISVTFRTQSTCGISRYSMRTIKQLLDKGANVIIENERSPWNHGEQPFTGYISFFRDQMELIGASTAPQYNKNKA
jgi:hypothetical protein